MKNLMLSGTGTTITILAVITVLVVLIAGVTMSIRIVSQGTAVIVERFGKYSRTLQTGLNMIVPILDKTKPAISLKEQVLDFSKVDVITKDNVTVEIDSIVFAQVVDPKLFAYGIEQPFRAIDNLTATTLRNIVGELDLDETLTSRDVVNSKMRAVIDTATDAWGIKVHRVEIKNIAPPKTIQESMERQMRAERERRETILIAEGKKRSDILVAEGEKEAMLLRAEADKLATIARAEGQAQAIERILKAKPDAAYLTLQGFEAAKEMANGQATKLVVPSNLTNVATMFSTMSEVLGHDKGHTVKEKVKK
jgi:regulator of protease activity HflC (stomatin/prohibitin superfamily)